MVSSHLDKAWSWSQAWHSHELCPAWKAGDGNKAGCFLPHSSTLTSRLLCPYPRETGWPKLARNILICTGMLRGTFEGFCWKNNSEINFVSNCYLVSWKKIFKTLLPNRFSWEHQFQIQDHRRSSALRVAQPQTLQLEQGFPPVTHPHSSFFSGHLFQSLFNLSSLSLQPFCLTS